MNTILDILKETGAIITNDHFVYTSGKHGSVYINKDALYPHTEKASKVGELFAEKVKDKDIDVVVGPALGGIILSQWTAYHLSRMKGKEVLGVYTEKDKDSNQVFGRRGYDKLIPGKNVLIVEDLTTTGGSVKKVVNTVKATGGNIVAVGVMINRNPKDVNEVFMKTPFFSLGEFEAQAFDENECPLCREGKPINSKIGHGKKFLERLSPRSDLN
ncbi:MAG: orotate phosphoribosyltransferase [Candidatus Levybacteria bacterium]|nr:orotate phosphoribosyltransferase [Candidatus Levybacteria bacterium]